MDRDEVEVHKLAKKERGQYPAILTEQTWSITHTYIVQIFEHFESVSFSLEYFTKMLTKTGQIATGNKRNKNKLELKITWKKLSLLHKLRCLSKKHNFSTYRFWPVCRSSHYPFNNWCYFERFEAYFSLGVIGTSKFLPTAIKLRHVVVLTADYSRAPMFEPRVKPTVRGRRVGVCACKINIYLDLQRLPVHHIQIWAPLN